MIGENIYFFVMFPKTSWCVGDLCRAIYSEDGMEYEAKIVKITPEENVAFIRFIG